MNINNSFAVLSYLFHTSANKLSCEKFTKQLRQNYEKRTIADIRKRYERTAKELRWLILATREFERVTNSLRNYS